VVMGTFGPNDTPPLTFPELGDLLEEGPPIMSRGRCID
jgi:hypothetical protein